MRAQETFVGETLFSCVREKKRVSELFQKILLLQQMFLARENGQHCCGKHFTQSVLQECLVVCGALKPKVTEGCYFRNLQKFTRPLLLFYHHRYSSDGGATWATYVFTTSAILARDVVTQPGERLPIFLIYGTRWRDWTVFHLNMTSVLGGFKIGSLL